MKAADGKDPIPHDRGLKSGHLAPHFAAARLARSLRIGRWPSHSGQLVALDLYSTGF
jgi:hypothetical protein